MCSRTNVSWVHNDIIVRVAHALPALLLLQEAHQQLQQEKQQHQRLTGSLLEHAGRLSHKYASLADDYGDLRRRWGC